MLGILGLIGIVRMANEASSRSTAAEHLTAARLMGGQRGSKRAPDVATSCLARWLRLIRIFDAPRCTVLAADVPMSLRCWLNRCCGLIHCFGNGICYHGTFSHNKVHKSKFTDDREAHSSAQRENAIHLTSRSVCSSEISRRLLAYTQC